MLSILPLSQLAADRLREAIALLFAHLASTERHERIEQFLSAIEANELNPATTLTAWSNDCVFGIQVVEILAGNAAAIWAIRTRPGSERIAVEDAVLQAAVALLQSTGVKFAQCLLSPDEPFAAEALRRRGIHRLTRVNHLRASSKGVIRENDTLDTLAPATRFITFVPFDECDENTFERVFIQSFEGTLDCPELNDLRTADEILAGHRTSAPDRSRWWLIRHADEAAGVLVLADAATPNCWDLAYLGVSPAARRKSIGRAALVFALQQAKRAGKEGITLMVDERNRPALNLYEKLGFMQWAARDVYLWQTK